MKLPSGVTSLNLPNIAVRGTLMFDSKRYPFYLAWYPNFGPMSPDSIPGRLFWSWSLIGTKNA